jgi:hypothetical protein
MDSTLCAPNQETFLTRGHGRVRGLEVPRGWGRRRMNSWIAKEFGAVSLCCVIIQWLIGTCHCTAFQIRRLYFTKSEPQYGLWLW